MLILLTMYSSASKILSTNLIFSGVASRKFWWQTFLILGEQQYFVGHTTSQSTNLLDIPNILSGHGLPGCTYAYFTLFAICLG